ncbi:hypothetical protein RUND412_008634 [Rhizina undulata]
MCHKYTRASAKARDQHSGSGNKAQNSAQGTLGRAGSTIDSAVEDVNSFPPHYIHIHHPSSILHRFSLTPYQPPTGKARINESEQKLRKGKDQTGAAVMSKTNEADRKIETEAPKAKLGLAAVYASTAAGQSGSHI